MEAQCFVNGLAQFPRIYHVSVKLSISCGGSWKQTVGNRQFHKNSKLHSQYRRFQVGAARNLANISSKEITLCVEGNIGVGKTTFLREILAPGDSSLEDLVNLIPEPVNLWQHVERPDGNGQGFNILDEFYKNPNRYAYTFQHFVFMTRFIQEKNTQQSGFPLRVIERSVFSDKNVFTEALRESGWLSELEYSLYHAWFAPIIQVNSFS